MMPSSTAVTSAATMTATTTTTPADTTTSTSTANPTKNTTASSTNNLRTVAINSSGTTMSTTAKSASAANCSVSADPLSTSTSGKSNLTQATNQNSSQNKSSSTSSGSAANQSVPSGVAAAKGHSSASQAQLSTSSKPAASATSATSDSTAPPATKKHEQSGSLTRQNNPVDTDSTIASSATQAQLSSSVVASSPAKNNKSATNTSSAASSSTSADNVGNSQNNSSNTSVILPNPPRATKLGVVNGSLSSDQSRASTEGHRTPSVDISKTNLYIKGLQTTTNDQDLYEMCVRFGQISSTKAIVERSTGCCKGYGFVEFTSPQAAEAAVQELTKEGVQAQMARISPSYSNHSNSSSHHHHHHSHHQNQYHHVGRSQMHHHHNSHHGHGNSNNNNSNSGNGSSNNNASSQHHSSGYNVASAYQHNQNSTHGNSGGHGSGGHHNNPDPTNLYIANLPPNMSEQELESLLSSYGSVVSTRILRDQTTNIPRGVGFARMESRDKCEQIIEQLNGRPYKGCQEPLLVKFADGGNKKRNYHNNLHHHNNSSHHRSQKSHQDDTRWRDSAATVDLGSMPSFEHQGNISHNNHLTDLAMMGPMAYHARMPIFPPAMQAGSGYPNPMGPQTNAPQWIHTGGHSQPYVIPQPIMPTGGLNSSNQAATAAMQYGHHIPQLTSQLQGLQIAHPGASVPGYLTPQHQWSQP